MDKNNANNGCCTQNGSCQCESPMDYPFTEGFKPSTYVTVGGILLASDPIEYNTTRPTLKLVVHNTGDRPIQVGSHFHFFEVNRYMEFDRMKAFGYHLNIPASTAIRFEPGEEKEVEVVAFGGKRRIIGFNGLTEGFAGLEDSPTFYPKRIIAKRNISTFGFKSIDESDAESGYTEDQITKK